MTCKLYRLAYRVLPLSRFRAGLIDRHLNDCPRCQTSLAGEDEIRRRLAAAAQIYAGKDWWPQVRLGIEALERKERLDKRRLVPARPRWRAALVGVPLLLLALLVPHLFDGGKGEDAWAEHVRNKEVKVTSLRIDQKPARSYYFNSGDRNTVIVWVARQE